MWVVPVMELVDFTLGAVAGTDENGQVTATGEEHAHLPLPVAVRVLELASGDLGDSVESSDESTYRFDGYRVEHSEKVTLTSDG